MRKLVLVALLAVPLSQAQTVVAAFDSPDTGICGLACGGGFLWAVDGTTHFAYKLDPATCAVLDSWYLEALQATENPTGLAFGNNTLFVAGSSGTSANIYSYTPDGAFGSAFTVNC